MTKTPAAAHEEETVIKLRVVAPRIPKDEKEALQLDEDLEQMGCAQLRHRPWGLKGEYMIRELRVGALNQYVVIKIVVHPGNHGASRYGS